MTRTNPGAKSVEKTTPKSLPVEVPVYGPRFEPPTYLHLKKRNSAFHVKPDTSYVRPLTIIHPYYFPDLAKCHQCGSMNVKWEGWNAYGYRDVHGISYEETALGSQLSCKDCKQRGIEEKGSKGKGVQEKGKGVQEKGKAGASEKDEKIHHCFAMTNAVVWEKRQLWEIPRECSNRASKNT